MEGFELPLQFMGEVWKNPTIENAKRLSDELDNRRTLSLINSGRENAILVTILKLIATVNVRNRNEIIVHLIQAVTKIIEPSHVHSVISLKTILVILLKEIYEEQSKSKPSCVKTGLSEELKLAIVNCVEVAMRRATYEVVEQFFTKENRIFIAEMLSVCVDLISKESYRQLRMASIKCIMSLKYVHDEADPDDIVLRNQVADVVFILLPKVLSTLIQVATGDETQGHALIAMSITALGRVFRLIFEDDPTMKSNSIAEETRLFVLNALNQPQQATKSDSDILALTLKSASNSNKLEQVNAKPRSKEWLQAAAQKCLPLIEKLHKLIGTKHANVRKELSVFCSGLLGHCQQNMASCVPALLQINLGLSDEQTHFTLDDNSLDIVENLFLEHLMKLPRIFYTGDEDEQSASSAAFYGFILALCRSDRIRITLANESTLRNLVSALLCAIELDMTSKLLEGDQTVYEIGEEVTESIVNLQNKTPWKTYRNIRNENLITTIEKICHLLGDSQTASTFLIDFLLKSLHSNSPSCNEALVLLQLVLKGSDKCRAHCELVIEELLVEDRWTLSMTVVEPERRAETTGSKWFEDRTEGLYESAISMRISDSGQDQQAIDRIGETITLNDVQFNILHTCLVIETLGLCSVKMGSHFQPFLLRSLRCLLEKSASKHYMIQMAAVLALSDLKNASGLQTIADLITQNADYITFSINSALKSSDRCPAALSIFKVVLHYCPLESMPHLENIIATVLHEGARTNQTKNNLAFIELFRTILLAIRRTLCEKPTQKSEAEINGGAKSDRNWTAMLNAAVEDHDEEMVSVDTEEGANDDDVDIEPEQSNPKPPALIEQTDKIMKRCVRNLSSTNREEKIATFETLCIGLDIISRFDEVLFPMVHLIWGPFTQQCMRDKSPVVIRRCICLLTKLAEYSRDFIHQRFATEILPFILSVLTDLSRNEFGGFLYEQSQQFKLLQELLTNLAEVLIDIEIRERNINQVLDATVWLLDNKQPKQLQEKGIEFFQKLFAFDKTTVYVKLIKYHHDSSDRSMHNCLEVIGDYYS